jgi:hypothetical protein
LTVHAVRSHIVWKRSLCLRDTIRADFSKHIAITSKSTGLLATAVTIISAIRERKRYWQLVSIARKGGF